MPSRLLQVSALDLPQPMRSSKVVLLGSELPTWVFQIVMTYSDSVTALQGILVYTVYGTLNTLNFGPED